jgi:plastocyanin
MRKVLISFAAALALVVFPAAASVAAEASPLIVIKDHKFEPAEIRVPAGQRIKLVVENRDATPEEFESHDLRIEKVIAGGAQASIWIGPLPKGSYSFVGEFHEDSAKGRIIVE